MELLLATFDVTLGSVFVASGLFVDEAEGSELLLVLSSDESLLISDSFVK